MNWKIGTMAIRRKPRDCPEYADRLVDFSDGELAADERLVIAEHIASCPGCREGLAQLDSSRDRLLNGISSTRVELPRAPVAARRSLRWAATAAAIGLICVTTLWVVRVRTFIPQLTGGASSPVPVETIAVPKLSQHDALWQIALVEQQARLQTSLDLWPKDESYNEHRERNRSLLAKFQSLTEASLTGSVP
jgi:anti-sigma factor RsiW